jgi:hypothetical protein
MPRMIDLIRASAVPSNIVQSAARGSLTLPPAEMVEILVHLARENPVFAEQARLTLAGWDEESSRVLAADSNTGKEILDYMAAPENFRPALLPALLLNSAISDAAMAQLMAAVSRPNLDVIFASPRAQCKIILEALASNPSLSESQLEHIRSRISPAPAKAPADSDGDEVLGEEVTAYLAEHAAEIAGGEKPFQPIGGMHEEILQPSEPKPVAVAATSDGAAAAAPALAGKKNATEPRGSALQKISHLDVKGRIQLAMKGSKEERSILVRDGTKVVALAVLESPKVTDAEVEMFASQKNVLESLLRGISMKRRFIKNYNVVRNLTCNPRTPLDVSLGLMKNLLIGDLKTLSGNKDVSETIRKLALKMYKMKRDPSKKDA